MDISQLSENIISLATLTLLEVILGIDNLVFLTIISSRLPKHQQQKAQRIGLFLALLLRLLFLAGVVWIVGLIKPLFTVYNYTISARDILLLLGGLFLIAKTTSEIHSEIENHNELLGTKNHASFFSVITQIALLDIIFSFDSILTAIGLTRTYWIMATAITIAITAMMIASKPLTAFINRYPTIKMLALSFLILIGTVLIADGLHFEIPRGYIYFSLSFSLGVEALNNLVRRKRAKSEK